MLREIKIQAMKAGQSPGHLSHSAKKPRATQLTVMDYSKENCTEWLKATLEQALRPIQSGTTRWIQVEGLADLHMLGALQQHFKIHPLTAEDILNVVQRAKTEEFDNYVYVTLKVLHIGKNRHTFRIGQVSLILGENFVITFSDKPLSLFADIQKKLQGISNQRLREQKADYLFYRLIDAVIDRYFIVLEGLGEKIDTVESLIMNKPERSHTRLMYQLKRKTLTLRKAVWPIREAVNHLTEVNDQFIGKFTRTYLRDVYDHTMQSIDTIETYRDILSSMLDIYHSSMTNRLNEVMKTLTVIATIFIPITFIASVYGMNFHDMPELSWKYGYPYAWALMLTCIVTMIVYFRRKKWF